LLDATGILDPHPDAELERCNFVFDVSDCGLVATGIPEIPEEVGGRVGGLVSIDGWAAIEVSGLASKNEHCKYWYWLHTAN